MNRQVYAIYYAFLFFLFLNPIINLKAYNGPRTSELDHCVSGHVWIDEDKDGKKQDNEENLTNVLIHLYDFTANRIGTTLTDTEGNFLFGELGAREYIVEIFHLFGYDFLDTNSSEFAPIKITIESVQCASMDEGIEAAMILSEEAASVTNIQLDPFYVPGQRVGLKLQWVTEREIDTQGFNILRSTTGKYEDAIKVNSNIILAKGSGEYEYYDTSIIPVENIFYSYWLSETELDGRSSDFGPIHSSIDIAEYDIHGYFLPLVIK